MKTNHRTLALLAATLVPGWTGLAAAETGAVARTLPVKEVTVFKDGHAFVLHEGAAPTDRRGDVVLEYLPNPVIGTFWAYSTDARTSLKSVVAGERRTAIRRTALTLREVLEANVGAEAIVTETNQVSYPASILGFPTRSAEELAATSPPGAAERLPEKGPLVLLKTAEGTKAVDVGRIGDVTFKQPPNGKVSSEEMRRFLTLGLDWRGQPAAPAAKIGLVYLQKGIRWIPSYRVDLDGKGKAVVKLQATVLNEMCDLSGTTLQLVIGVPTFYFKDTVDPIGLQQTAVQLSQFFQADAGRARASALASNFSNAMMTQVARMGDYRSDVQPAEGGEAPVPEGARREDLFVFTVPDVTLRKGERIVLPLVEIPVPYEDVFALDVPFAPPPEVRQNLNSQQQAELARLFNAPRVMHKARLKNDSAYPFTTAPALVLREGRVLAQGMMTYAASGASADLSITAAVDIQVKKSDSETKRTPNAVTMNGTSYMRVDLDGKVRLTNHRTQSVEVEVVRHALGQIDSADHDGKVEMNNVFEGTDYQPVGGEEYPYWWSWYSWPWWWHHLNGVGRVTWKVTLESGKPVDLGYAWHYYWR